MSTPALDYARGRRALRPLSRSLTFVAELIAKPFRKAADFCDAPGPWSSSSGIGVADCRQTVWKLDFSSDPRCAGEWFMAAPRGSVADARSRRAPRRLTPPVLW